ncbi:unnamed protein product, partial [marine sediment metagenome]
MKKHKPNAERILDILDTIGDWIFCELSDKHLIPIYDNGKYTGKYHEPWDFKIIYWCLQFPF